MARKLLIAAGVLSLMLVGALGGVANADSDSGISIEDGVVTWFGTTYCLQEAPSDARCDWRISEDGKARQTTFSWTLLGETYCIGEKMDADCDHEYPIDDPDKSTAEPWSKVLDLFGKTWCFGEVPLRTDCDVRLPFAVSDKYDRRASL